MLRLDWEKDRFSLRRWEYRAHGTCFSDCLRRRLPCSWVIRTKTKLHKYLYLKKQMTLEAVLTVSFVVLQSHSNSTDLTRGNSFILNLILSLAYPWLDDLQFLDFDCIDYCQAPSNAMGEVLIVSDMHQRKAEMSRRADAFIALPGELLL